MKRSFLCLALTEKSFKQNIRIFRENRAFIDLVELRADFLTPSEFSSLGRYPEHIDVPVILTVRRKDDGGNFPGSEAERRELMRKSISGDFAYVDLEEDFTDKEFEKKLETRKITIIRSFHDIHRVPENLSDRIKTLKKGESEIPKIAVTPQNTGELYTLLSILKELDPFKQIAVGMGEYGVPTRILSTLLGSMISYCSSNRKPAASGHFEPWIIANAYRFRELNRNTEIFGIIGNPILHSNSPFLHNRAFTDLDINAVYVPFQVDDIEAFLKIADLLHIKGFSVTIPHKQTILKFLDDKHESVHKIGACNTVLIKNGSLFGTNTDAPGFIEPLKKYFDFKGKHLLKAAVIGAGGAARACIFALRQAGVEVLVLNRTREKAALLGQEFKCEYGGLGKEDIARIADFSDIIVQTTSVGMEGAAEGDPIADYKFHGTELVYDLIYNPRLTVLLERALNSGCKVINGEEMLVAQADAQFKYFTGKESTFKHLFPNDLIR